MIVALISNDAQPSLDAAAFPIPPLESHVVDGSATADRHSNLAINSTCLKANWHYNGTVQKVILISISPGR